MRLALAVGAIYVGFPLAVGAAIIALSRRRDTPPTFREAFDAELASLRNLAVTANVPLLTGDPLDGLNPAERELFLEAWWQDVLEMPENELAEDEHAYLRWVDSLPEATA